MPKSFFAIHSSVAVGYTSVYPDPSCAVREHCFFSKPLQDCRVVGLQSSILEITYCFSGIKTPIARVVTFDEDANSARFRRETVDFAPFFDAELNRNPKFGIDKLFVQPVRTPWKDVINVL